MGHNRAIVVALLCVLALSACAMQPVLPGPSKPFYFDGCTLAPDLNLRACCYAHDRDYWCGGTKQQRKRADRALRACIEAAGHPWLDFWYYWGTRIGGVSWLPTPWRWGFGWPWGQGNSDEPRVCEEVEQVGRMSLLGLAQFEAD